MRETANKHSGEPVLLISKGKAGWQRVEDVIDIRVKKNTWKMADGRHVEGMECCIVMDHSTTCAGQVVLRKLVEKGQRLVKVRSMGRGGEMRMTLQPYTIQTDPTEKKLYAVIARITEAKMAYGSEPF